MCSAAERLMNKEMNGSLSIVMFRSVQMRKKIYVKAVIPSKELVNYDDN